jgi:hypothetical protein
MKYYTAQTVLDSIKLPPHLAQEDLHTQLVYKLGVLSGWMARLANQDFTVRQEVEARSAQPGSARIVQKA